MNDPLVPQAISGGGAAETNTKEMKKGIWFMHRRMVAATFLLSILFLYMLSIAVCINISNAGMFSFGWSNRIIEAPGRDKIAELYIQNLDTSQAKLDSILKDSLNMAFCRSVFFHF